MYGVGKYEAVRRAYNVEGRSKRWIMKEFLIHHATLEKMLAHSEPPGYQRQKPPAKPKLDPYTGIIDQILKEDQERHRKQRHTAKRIFERLQDEHGFDGGYTIVKDYVRKQRRLTREMFVPLAHPPGHAQADFGEARAFIGGEHLKIHFLAVSLPFSDAVFVQAYPAENTESLCEGHNAALSFFGGVPLSILYDNTKLAVIKILETGERKLTDRFTALVSHYLFEPRFGRPARGNDKGKVENMVGFVRRNFMVPEPRFESFEALNDHLAQKCHERLNTRLRGQNETIGEKLERDRQTFLPLPATPHDACEKVSTQVSSTSLVRYRNNDYSVPTRYGYHDVLVQGYVHEVIISCGAERIACHRRSYDKADLIFDPLHYLALLEQKTGALEQAAPLVGWPLPEAFETLLRLLKSRAGKRGKREYVQVLRLLETFPLEMVHGAVQHALELQAISYDAIKHLVLCRQEGRPAHLDLNLYPYLPGADVKSTNASDYKVLMSDGGGHA